MEEKVKNLVDLFLNLGYRIHILDNVIDVYCSGSSTDIISFTYKDNEISILHVTDSLMGRCMRNLVQDFISK